MRTTTLIVLMSVILAACSTEGGFKLPGVYRPDIQQGNIIKQEMIDKLKPGMDKNQVKFIMGTPAVVDPFHTDRWDYLYTMSEGGARREQRHITLYFKDNKLTHIEGDVVTAPRKTIDEIQSANASTTVDVPIKESRDNIFKKIFGFLPWVDDDRPQREHPPAESQGSDTGSGDR